MPLTHCRTVEQAASALKDSRGERPLNGRQAPPSAPLFVQVGSGLIINLAWLSEIHLEHSRSGGPIESVTFRIGNQGSTTVLSDSAKIQTLLAAVEQFTHGAAGAPADAQAKE